MEDPGELFLATKPQNERNLLEDRLSRITKLKLDCRQGFSIRSIKFASKYLTGLRKFELSASMSMFNWSELHDEVISNNVLDLFCSAKDYGSLHFGNMKLTHLSRHYLTMLKKIYESPAATTTTNYLRLERSPHGLATQFRCRSSLFKRSISVTISEDIGMKSIMQSLFTCDFSKLDALILTIPRNCTDVLVYFDIFLRIPMLKKVTLDTPTHSHLPEVKLYDFEKRRPLLHVEELTLLPTASAGFKKLLEMCWKLFQNLRRLNIYHFSGIFDEDLGEFQLCLPKYSLHTLSCDMTPVKEKSLERWGDEELIKQKDFLVIQIEILKTGRRYLYKATLDFSVIEKINDRDLVGCIRGEDYYRVSITVANLDYIELCMASTASFRRRSYFHESDHFADIQPKIKKHRIFLNIHT